MANNELIAGVNSYLNYGVESTYGTAATLNKNFGGLITSFSPSMKNNLSKLRGFQDGSNNGRDVSHVLAQKFEASLSLEMTPLNWYWLEYVLGGVSGAGSVASPFLYVGANTPSSLSIGHALNNVTTDREETYLGCVINSVTIKAAVGEPVTISMEILTGDIDKDAALTAAVALPTLNPFTFAGATIEIPNASTISNIIDSVEITITNNVEIKYGLGARIGKRPNFKERDYAVKFTVKYLDETLIEKFLGASGGPATGTPAADATLAVRFDNSATHFVDFVFSSGYIEDFSEGNGLNEMITEDITYVAKSLSVTETISA